jgi:hypothetical protein
MVSPVGNTPKPQGVDPSTNSTPKEGGLDNETKNKIEDGLKDAGLKPEQIEQIMKALEEKLGGGGQPKTGGGGGGGSPKTGGGGGGGEQDPMKMLEQLLQSLGIPPEQVQQIMQQIKGGSGAEGEQFPGGQPTEEQPA